MIYKSYKISQEYDLRYYATDPDADYDCDGDPGAYFQCSGLPQHSGATVEDCKKEVDEFWMDEAFEIMRRETGYSSFEYMTRHMLAG